jgi:hypothetical protein
MFACNSYNWYQCLVDELLNHPIIAFTRMFYRFEFAFFSWYFLNINNGNQKHSELCRMMGFGEPIPSLNISEQKEAKKTISDSRNGLNTTQLLHEQKTGLARTSASILMSRGALFVQMRSPY